MINFKAALSYAVQKFLTIGLTTPNLDARLLLAFVLKKSECYILVNLDIMLAKDEYNKFIELVKRRLNHEPIAYILGQKEFYGNNFFVTNDVLIPRPSTELLIDILLKKYHKAKNDKLYILDLGTGSGCIIITILLHLLKAKGTAIDISQKALSIGKKNAELYNLTNRLKFIESNWFKKLPLFDDRKYDIIISNPPYISQCEKNIVAKETLLYEPEDALFANSKGLEAYKNIARQAKNYLKKDGKLIIEIGFNQQEKIINLFLAENYYLINKYKDLQGHDRALMFK